MSEPEEEKTALEWLATHYPESPKKRLKEWFAHALSLLLLHHPVLIIVVCATFRLIVVFVRYMQVDVSHSKSKLGMCAQGVMCTHPLIMDRGSGG